MPPSPRLVPFPLPWMLSAGLLAATAWLIAGLVWSIAVPGYTYPSGTTDSAEPATASRSGPSPAADAPPRSGFTRSAEFSPFGSPRQAAPQAIEDAPDTRLSLELLGILATGQGNGSAIISAGRANVELYHVGDTIGNQLATLHQVHADRVILEREGRLETLRLPRGDELRVDSGRSDTDQRSSQTAGSPAPITANISRSRWLDDPQRAMNSLRAQPVLRDGALLGIRVTPTRNQREFERAGLQEGDIITSVQGQQIRDIDDPEQILAGLGNADRVNITIERDGQTLPLTIELTE
ncbi:type II secretion system protein GspC [Thioalkalivibrio sp. ALMg3]|uniref:type II secretion system protein GspC n=1 Tax=Thioalkalivibrio sp. ALMg3 TaxID=1158163 RepID=UPI000476878A|nr:type II secretion system protein GspC [Thioalkalivibrio sp. ALMg3]